MVGMLVVHVGIRCTYLRFSSHPVFYPARLSLHWRGLALDARSVLRRRGLVVV